MLIIFQQFNIPEEAYKLENFTPGIIIFGFSFITLFTGSLIAKDRESSLLIRLGTSPMKPKDYILGYILSLIPIVLIQIILFFMVAIIMGLSFNINIIYSLFISIIISIFFITIGILIGSLVSEKGVGGVGSVIVQLVCFTSGMYFSKDLVGKVFAKICEILPFESMLNIIKCTLNNNIVEFKNIAVFLIYTIITLVISIYVFKIRMVSDNK